MKLLVYSDLHLDMCPLTLQLDPDFLGTIDVEVLAGDITEGTKGLLWGLRPHPQTHNPSGLRNLQIAILCSTQNFDVTSRGFQMGSFKAQKILCKSTA